MTAIQGFFGEYRWLSNFYLVDVDYNFIVYPSAEHAYQASKTFSVKEKMEIADMARPGSAKKKGSTFVLPKSWDQHKLVIMRDIVTIKFNNEFLRKKLLATGTADIIETNRWGDDFWGVCSSAGQNHLGKIIMSVRRELQEEHGG